MPKIEEAKKRKVKGIPDLGQSLTEYRVEGGGRFSSIIWTRAAPPITNSAVALRFFGRHETGAVTSDPPPLQKSEMTVDILLGIAKPVGKISVLCEMCIFRFFYRSRTSFVFLNRFRDLFCYLNGNPGSILDKYVRAYLFGDITETEIKIFLKLNLQFLLKVNFHFTQRN